MPVSLGDRLKEARKAAGMTQRQLADKIKVSNTSISNWENGFSNPDPDTIQHLCWALDVQPNYFFAVEDAPAYPKNIIPLPKMYKVPLIGTIACGAPILAAEHIEDYVDTPEHIRADFALTCKGDSMINARIFDGDTVYIQQQDTVNSGEIAAVLIDTEATLKRVRFHSDRIILEPANPLYDPLVFRGEEMNTVRILGKAVAFTSAIR